MNRVNIFRDVCQVLGLTQIDNSWVKTLGLHLGLEQKVGDDYEQRVFVSCFANGTSTNSGSVEIFDTFSDFPATGEDNTLYVTKDANIIYRWDTTLLSYQILNDPNIVNPDAPEEGSTFYVRLATSSTLNACTYDNGTAGVGATLTGNVNGILSQSNQTGRIDATVPVLGDVILVKNQSAALQNGIYEISTLGNSGTPFILTRIDGYNETDEVYPSIVFVSAGSSNINRYFTQSTKNPVIGTNGLVYGVATVTFPASTIVFADTYTNSTVEFPGAFTYTNGTLYPTTLPGYLATITANANGALGTINGVNMTSGRRILINDPTTPLLNGDYTVINAGSATQRWQLRRINYHSGGLLSTVREWYISNPLSEFHGSRFACSQATIDQTQIGISQSLNFSKQNITGLKDSPNSIQIDGSTLGIADISINSTNNFAVSVDDSTTNCYLDITPTVVELNSSGNYINIDKNNDNSIEIFAQGDVDIAADNGQINTFGRIFASQDIILKEDNMMLGGEGDLTQNNSRNVMFLGNAAIDDFSWEIGNLTGGAIGFDGTDIGLTSTVGIINIQASGGVIMQSNTDEVQIQGQLTTTVRSITDAVNIESIDGSNVIRVDGVNSEVSITTGQINLSSIYLKASPLPNYVNDAAADADTDLPTGAFYTLGAGRAIYQKP